MATKKIGFRQKKKIKRRFGSCEVLNSQRNPGYEKIYHDKKIMLLKENQQKEYASNEMRYFGKTGICTFISHINGTYPKTIIRTKTNSAQSYEKQNQIFSLVITVQDGDLVYKANERCNGGTGKKVREARFQALYDDPWIAGSRHVQNELYAIEQTIAGKKDSIEKHLGVELA